MLISRWNPSIGTCGPLIAAVRAAPRSIVLGELGLELLVALVLLLRQLLEALDEVLRRIALDRRIDQLLLGRRELHGGQVAVRHALTISGNATAAKGPDTLEGCRK